MEYFGITANKKRANKEGMVNKSSWILEDSKNIEEEFTSWKVKSFPLPIIIGDQKQVVTEIAKET